MASEPVEATEAEALRWEDEIDVDDSDLLLRLVPPSSSSSSYQNLTLSSQFPPLRSCSHLPTLPSQSSSPPPPPPPPPPSSLFRSTGDPYPGSPRLIPGPAGHVQAAMRRRSAALGDAPRQGDLGEDTVGQEPDEEDGDFKLNPWLCALEFLGEDCDLVRPICSIKTRDAERVPQVVGLVKSSTANGLGNLFLTLKDPTSSIGASIHQSVFSDCNLGGDISVGCVLILKQVVAFCPARSTRYLNVTSKNVIKLVNKDCGSPLNKTLPFSKAGGNNAESGHWTTEGEPSLRNAAKSLADKCVDHNKGVGGVSSGPHAAVCTKRVASLSHLELKEAGHQLASGERAKRLKISALGEAKSKSYSQWKISRADRCGRITMKVGVGVAAEPSAGHRAYGANGERSLSGATTVDSSKTDSPRGFQCDGLVQTSTTMMPAKSDVGANETKKLIQGASVAQWTDEQLLELFSDFQDEADLVNTPL